jgi:hypothetical protein
MLMTAADYRESLRASKPRVFVNGKAVGSVADEPVLAPGIAAVGATASSSYCTKDPAGSVMPDAAFSNIGKLLLATKIYDMHKIAHYVSGGLIAALSGPDQSADAGVPVCRPGRTTRHPVDRGSDRFASRRLVFGYLAPRGWLARGDQAGDLAQLPSDRESRICRRPA